MMLTRMCVFAGHYHRSDRRLCPGQYLCIFVHELFCCLTVLCTCCSRLQEYRSEKSLEELGKLVPPECHWWESTPPPPLCPPALSGCCSFSSTAKSLQFTPFHFSCRRQFQKTHFTLKSALTGKHTAEGAQCFSPRLGDMKSSSLNLQQ